MGRPWKIGSIVGIVAGRGGLGRFWPRVCPLGFCPLALCPWVPMGESAFVGRFLHLWGVRGLFVGIYGNLFCVFWAQYWESG